MHAYKHSHIYTCTLHMLAIHKYVHENSWNDIVSIHAWSLTSMYINLSTCGHSFFSLFVDLFHLHSPSRQLYTFQTLWLKHLDIILFPILLLLSGILCLVNLKTFTQPAHLKPTRRLFRQKPTTCTATSASQHPVPSNLFFKLFLLIGVC